MQKLQNMFFENSRQVRREEIVAFMNLKMKLGQVIKDHMITFIGHLSEVEIKGAQINKETQIETILNLLSNTFD